MLTLNLQIFKRCCDTRISRSICSSGLIETSINNIAILKEKKYLQVSKIYEYSNISLGGRPWGRVVWVIWFG